MITFTRTLVHKLTGKQLDWAATMAEGRFTAERAWDHIRTHKRSPSTNWGHGGPIMQQFKVDIRHDREVGMMIAMIGWYYAYGPTPLVAAMRCVAVHEFGEYMDVPVITPGRHPIPIDLSAVDRLRVEGLSYAAIAARLGVSATTLRARRHATTTGETT